MYVIFVHWSNKQDLSGILFWNILHVLEDIILLFAASCFVRFVLCRLFNYDCYFHLLSLLRVVFNLYGFSFPLLALISLCFFVGLCCTQLIALRRCLIIAFSTMRSIVSRVIV